MSRLTMRLSLAVMVGGGLALFAAASGVSAQERPAGAIAFESFKNGSSDLYTIAIDGTGLRRLTRDPRNDESPAWSPDGTRIAFTRERSDELGALSDVFVMRADGTRQVRLTRTGAGGERPTWSPDGTRIAFHRSTRDRGVGIYVMNADGSNTRRITAGRGGFDMEPTWSPDGKFIAFTKYTGEWPNRHVFVVPANGGRERMVAKYASVASRQAWSPDGRQLLVNDPGVTAVIVNGGKARRHLTKSTPADSFGGAWSPDGALIVFATTRAAKVGWPDSEIYVMNADGTAPRRLTRIPAENGDAVWQPR